MSEDTGFRIERLWLSVAIQENGERAYGVMGDHGELVALVAADTPGLQRLRKISRANARGDGETIRLIRFEARVVEEVFYPDGRVERPA